MSWIEVESKIRVDNVSEARRRIKKISSFVGVENKKDSYYALTQKGYPTKSLRVRNKGKSREVNFKQRIDYVSGVWAKKEVEFKVSDLNGFFDLLNDFGFKRWMKKEKKTYLYKTKSGVNIELNYVKRLGWFIEIEVLCRENRKEIAKARRKVVNIMTKLGVEKKFVEKRGYTKQLWNLKH